MNLETRLKDEIDLEKIRLAELVRFCPESIEISNRIAQLEIALSVLTRMEKTLNNERATRNEIIVELWIGGMSQSKIGVEVGLSQASVGSILRKYCLNSGSYLLRQRKKDVQCVR